MNVLQVPGLEDVIKALLPPNFLGSSSAVQLPSDVAASNLLHLLQQHGERSAGAAAEVQQQQHPLQQEGEVHQHKEQESHKNEAMRKGSPSCAGANTAATA